MEFGCSKCSRNPLFLLSILSVLHLFHFLFPKAGLPPSSGGEGAGELQKYLVLHGMFVAPSYYSSVFVNCCVNPFYSSRPPIEGLYSILCILVRIAFFILLSLIPMPEQKIKTRFL